MSDNTKFNYTTSFIQSPGYYCPPVSSGEDSSEQFGETQAGRMGQVEEHFSGEHDDPKFHGLVKGHGGKSDGKKYSLPTSNLEKFHEAARKSGFKYKIKSGHRLFQN